MLVVNQKQETHLHVKSNLIHQNNRKKKKTQEERGSSTDECRCTCKSMM